MRTTQTLAVAAAAVAGATAAGLIAASALAAPGRPAGQATPKQSFPSYSVKVMLRGSSLHHANSMTGKREALTMPDDITQSGGDLYTAFQNGVGPQGQAAADGNADSTVVRFTPGGSVVAQWDVRGKVDGLSANPATGDVIATVNEDANSSLYDISAGGVTHYRYNKALPHRGGTAGVSFYQGKMLVSASAPGTSGAAAPNPAVYSVTLNQATKVATVKPYLRDEARARVANQRHLGSHAKLALTDPDSSTVVPAASPRFRGDFMLTSQSDQEQVYSSVPGSLWVLKLSQAVDDTAWATAWHGALYVTDNAAGTVSAVDSREFWPGTAFVTVTPASAANWLGLLNMATGQITPVELRGATVRPRGMVFVPNAG